MGWGPLCRPAAFSHDASLLHIPVPSDRPVLFSFPSIPRPFYPVTVHPKTCLFHVILLAGYRLVSKQPQNFSTRHFKFLQDFSPVCILHVALFLCESEQLEGRDLVSPCTSIPNVLKYFSTSSFSPLCMYMCEWWHAHLWKCAHVESRNRCHVSSSIAPHMNFWHRVSHRIWSSSFGLPWLASKALESTHTMSHPLGSQAHTAMPGFQWSLGTCYAGIFPADPSPSPHI